VWLWNKYIFILFIYFNPVNLMLISWWTQQKRWSLAAWIFFTSLPPPPLIRESLRRLSTPIQVNRELAGSIITSEEFQNGQGRPFGLIHKGLCIIHKA
jgi:hypothetical protein